MRVDPCAVLAAIANLCAALAIALLFFWALTAHANF